MFVRSNQCRLRLQTDAGLFPYLADRCFDQPLAPVNTTRGNLGSCVGMVAMFEDEEAVCPLDVDDDSLPAGHAKIVGRSALTCRAKGV